MHKLCRINIENHQKLFAEIEDFVTELKRKLPIKRVYLFGSFARGEIHDGSDIDLLIVGDFKERFPYRIGKILDLTDLPVQPLVYTEEEFQAMQRDENPFVLEVLKTGRKL
jgi:hypothetical protein